MKVCMVVHQAYDYDSRVRRYAESLAERGMAVDVLCLSADGPPSPTPRNVRVLPIPLRRRHGARWRYVLEYGAALVLFAARAAALHARERYDVIHVHNMPDILIVAALLPRLLGARVILDIHDPMPEFYMAKYGAGPTALIVRLVCRQERLACALADAVITSNPSFGDKLLARGIPAAKVAVVANVPDARLFSRQARSPGGGRADGRYTLIYPGTIAPRYGLDVAVRALPTLAARIPGVVLVIIGAPTAYAAELACLAAALGVSSHLRLEPPVSLPEVPGHLAHADVGLYPARPDAHMTIATPSKVLEFAMMGLPVVASRLPALERLFPDSAIRYVQPDDVDALARAVLDLYEHPDIGDDMVRRADRAFVATHSWDAEFGVYLDVLHGRPHAAIGPTTGAGRRGAVDRTARPPDGPVGRGAAEGRGED